MMVCGQEPQHSAANRLDDAKKIERTIGELGQMFSKMAGLVAAQAEVRHAHVDSWSSDRGEISISHITQSTQRIDPPL